MAKRQASRPNGAAEQQPAFAPRSEAVNEILGNPPNILLKVGNLILLVGVVLLLIIGFNARYPDTVSAKLTLTTVNPAERLLAPRDITIDRILVRSGDSIAGGTVVMVFRSLALFQHVLALEDQLLSIEMPTDSALASLEIPNFLELGNLQEPLYTFEEKRETYITNRDKKLSGLTGQEIRRRIAEQQRQLSVERTQQTELEKEVALAERAFDRQQNLFDNGIVEEAILREAEQTLVRSRRLLRSSASRIRDLRFNLELLQSQVVSSQSTEDSDLLLKARDMRESFSTLFRAVEEWKQNNLLTAPKAGVIIPNIDVREKQRFPAGSMLATLLPLNPEGVLGRIDLPLQGSGKVSVGQRVIIKFLNYPYEEFGVVEGQVLEKSPIPSGEVIPILVSLPQGMITNTGNQLEPVPFMLGDAEIIVGERRLLAWLLNK